MSPRSTPTPVRLARVVREPGAASLPRLSRRPPGQVCPTPLGVPAPAVVLEAQGVRISVPPGFDSASLAAVLDVLDRRGKERSR